MTPRISTSPSPLFQLPVQPFRQPRRRRPSAQTSAGLLMLTIWMAALLSGCQQSPAGRTVVASAEEADLPTSLPLPAQPNEDETDSAGQASSEAANDQPGGEENGDEEESENEKKKKRRQVLLKTVYDDKELGEEQIPLIEAEMGIYRDEELERYVQRVALRLLLHAPPRPFDYEFKIIDQEVPNAFAVPGGKIYVSRGLLALANSEDELAAVLGHEITHAAERHSAARIEHARRINPLSLGYLRAATIAAYGRDQERDADRGGQILAAKAGYDPAGIATFLKKLDASERYVVGWSRLPNFLATHPTSPQRSALAAQRASEIEWTRKPSIAAERSEEYRNRVDGLIIGEDPSGGLFKDGRFIHPDLKFSLRFPPGWQTLNSPQAVSAVSPDRDAEISLTAAGAAGDLEGIVDEFIEGDEDGGKIRVFDRRPVKVGNLSGIRIEGRADGLHVSAAFVEYGDLVFRLTILSAGGAEAKYRGRTRAFLQSFRPLDEAGQYSLEVTKIRIAYARKNETLQQLSERTQNDLELVFTGILNDTFASTRLAQGQPIKIGLAEPYFPKAEEPEEPEEKSTDPGKDTP